MRSTTGSGENRRSDAGESSWCIRPSRRVAVIGAFHTDTLSGLDSIDGLVVTDERPEVVAAVAPFASSSVMSGEKRASMMRNCFGMS